MESAYSTTAKLFDKVDSNSLAWKPESGSNWMTVGQLLKHIVTACGPGCRAFLTEEWGLPPGTTWKDLPAEEILPPAEKLPSIESLQRAKDELAEDKAVALQIIEQAGEDNLINKQVCAPWAPEKTSPLGLQMLKMIEHLERHKDQLFYYLKLQGKPVNTIDLWGGM
ncbi:MAG TPA: DinB family protein [Terracidiphilus sp.]|nr:DinB family protein [Terracidiphilus sp.]